MAPPLVLQKGSRIGVLGGGPAGSFFALFASRLAQKLDLELEITIYDRKDFDAVGPRGCNMCAGAIGSSLVTHLKEMGLPLLPQIVRQEVVGYAFHGADRGVFLTPVSEEKIYTVFRGGGPRGDRPGAEGISFDQHLLNYAALSGAKIIRERVDGVEFPPAGRGKPVIKFNDNREEMDLVVGAFGVNSAILRRFFPGYRPPPTWHTCQTEVEADREFIREKLRDMIHIFSTVESGLHFLAITPKGNYLTVTGIGPYVRIKDLQHEMASPMVREYLPPHWESLCHCHPQVPVGHARWPYADRMVIIGDAGFCRYLKNGIESAFITAGLAAQCALAQGISRQDFHKHYYLGCRRLFAWDNHIGRLMFLLHRMFSSSDSLCRMCLDVAQREQADEKDSSKILSTILWHMFTGNVPYRQIFLKGLSAGLLVGFLRSFLSLTWRRAWAGH